jgi:nucleotide-binding universal stress UspA family protein
MTQLKRLLAATDLSAPARHAVERAAVVARATGAQLDVVHVAASLSRLDELRRLVANVPEDVLDKIQEQTAMLMDALAITVRERHGVEVVTHVASGALLEAIEEKASAVDADLLVLGARGASMLRRLMLGSTAARLVSRFSRPILVVKRMPAAEYRRVLVPVDFSDASLPAVQIARAVAPAARLFLLHAYEAPFEGKMSVAGVEKKYVEDYRRRARTEAEANMAGLCVKAALPPRTATTELVHGGAVQGILEHEEDQDCDLIVIGRQGQSPMEDMLLGSVSRRVLAESEADVLVVP